MRRHLTSLVLPCVVDLVVPFLLAFDFRHASLRVHFPYPIVQIVSGTFFCAVGLVLLVATIFRFARQGKGTLAPWDPPKHLVVEGCYAYTRNPMISGVAFVLLGETALLGSLPVLVWFAVVVVVNTVYFKLSEEPGLVRRFGAEYVDYRRHVPMWIPRLRPWKR
jgi:protein-S-isoprenylcysteine O-methyltransferase Ste14